MADDIVHRSNLLSERGTLKNFNSILTLIFKDSIFLNSWDEMIYYFMRLITELDICHNILGIKNSEIDNFYLHHYKQGIIPYSELKKLEITEETFFKPIIYLYALTYRENGHLRRLESLLYDDNYKIRNMAINGLIYALNNLTNFYYDKPHINLISKTLADIKHPFKYLLNFGHK